SAPEITKEEIDSAVEAKMSELAQAEKVTDSKDEPSIQPIAEETKSGDPTQPKPEPKPTPKAPTPVVQKPIDKKKEGGKKGMTAMNIYAVKQLPGIGKDGCGYQLPNGTIFIFSKGV